LFSLAVVVVPAAAAAAMVVVAFDRVKRSNDTVAAVGVK
jgi:hypothetical protein